MSYTDKESILALGQIDPELKEVGMPTITPSKHALTGF